MKRLLALFVIAPLVACSGAPEASSTATGSTPSTASPQPVTVAPSQSPPLADDRLVTPRGIGELRVGMTLNEGERLGLATEDDAACGTQITEDGARRYPNVWTYWNASGLQGLAVISKTDPDRTSHASEYATAAGLRVGQLWTQVKAAYPDAVAWPSDPQRWAGIDDVTLPFVGTGNLPALEGLLVRDGDLALVFLGNNTTVENLLVTTIDDRGLTRALQPC